MKSIVLSFILSLLILNLVAQDESGCVSGDCNNGFGTYIWGSDTESSGDKYIGNWKNRVPHGYGTYNFADGMKYEGEFVNNVREGFGTFTWTDGQKYIGEWKAGNQHGKGTHYYADGTTSSGTWEDGKLTSQENVQKETKKTGCISGDCSQGYGKYLWETGEKYDGYWANGMRNGQGTNYYTSGNVYSGEWKDDQQNGFGTMTYANGDKYTGYYEEHKLKGQGTFVYKNGDKYMGSFGNNMYNGQGTMYYVDGRVESGLWQDDIFMGSSSIKTEEPKTGCVSGDCVEGYGIYKWQNGEKYEGNWKRNKRNGEGTNYYSKGDVYVGQWFDDQQNGYGTITYSNGDQFTGNFILHKKTGQGSYIFKNGDKYIGEWDNDKYNGQGTLYYANGEIKSGTWTDNEFMGKTKSNITSETGCISGNCASGYGTYVWSNSEKYEGYWEQKKRSGQGTNYYSNGEECSGQWKSDKIHGDATYIYNNGDKYVGRFDMDIRTGQGTYYFKDGRKYIGEWANDKYNGEGSLYNNDGTIQSGIWKDNDYIGKSKENYGCISGDCNAGYGTYVFEKGDKYIGNWKTGKYSGQGTFFFSNGDKYVGMFLNSQFNGQGTYTFSSDGKKYVGEWKDSKYNGFGTLYYSNGTSLAGVWKENNYVGARSEKGKVPAITWIAPEFFNSSASAPSTTIKLCVESDSKVKPSKIYVNDVLQPDNSARGYSVVSTSCDYTIERLINLTNGDNKIKVVVENDNGSTTSDIRTISFKKESKERKIALVLGNSAYSSAALRNPENDAKAIGKSLQNLGFDVMLFTNVGQNDMKKQIRAFGEKLASQGGTGLFYYAGHGMQVNGENYLIPVDAKIDKEQDVEMEAVNIKRVLGEMEYARNDINIVILDACRNNPFVRSFRSGGNNGLATTTAPQGTFIAYATAPGSVAADGTGVNGLYTEELLQALQTPNLKIEDVFKKVRTNVYQKSNKMQVPWENSSIFGDFYFKKN